MAWKRSMAGVGRHYCIFRNSFSHSVIFILTDTTVKISSSRTGERTNEQGVEAMDNNRRIEIGAGVLRTGLGVMFIAHALLKYFVFTLPGTAQFFESLGLPAPLGYATFAAE